MVKTLTSRFDAGELTSII